MPFTFKIPCVFFIAGFTGGIKYAVVIHSLVILPRLVMLYPVAALYPKYMLLTPLSGISLGMAAHNVSLHD